MAEVKFVSENKTVDVEAGTTVLEAARLAGMVIDSPCNGSGTCGKCRVFISGTDNRNWKETKHCHLTQAEHSRGIVISCQCMVYGDVEVQFVQKGNEKLKILSQGMETDIDVAPRITKTYDAVNDETTVYSEKTALFVEPKNTVADKYGVAIDIGTTTLVASLINLNDGCELAVASGLNPQARYAQDVLSRIKLGSQPEGLNTLHGELIRELNRLIADVADSAHISVSSIYEAIFSGNTTMLHLSTHTDPASLGKYPYRPVIRGNLYFEAASIGLAIANNGAVYVPPVMSAYVGADITSGILVTGLTHQNGTTLFVDIGTNGEMVLAVNGVLTATSTAAGPAFEGMNISCGMRAGSGAVESVVINDGNITLETIGDIVPSGICGSGLLDAVGELSAHGYIDKNGRFITKGNDDKFRIQDEKAVFCLAENVYLSQKDIRQVQLAKAAVRAGIETMLTTNGIRANQVDSVLIAGSFGYHLRATSLFNIGLLPRDFEGRVKFVGNTSKSGARAFLVNNPVRDEAAKWVKSVRVIELADDPQFEKTFIGALSF